MADNNQVTLVFTRNFSPYNKGDVATFDRKTAEALQNPTYVNEKGREVSLPDGSPVEAYSESKHSEQLAASRGKTEDAEVQTPFNTENGGYYTGTEIEAIIKGRLKAEHDRTVLNGSPLSSDTTKTYVNRTQQAQGTIVTDPQGYTANGQDPAKVDAAQKEAAAKLNSDAKASDEKKAAK